MRRRSFAVLVSSLVLAGVASAGCGSRTGLGSDLAGTGPEEPKTPTSLTCVAGSFQLRPSSTEVLFVIDRSGSMSGPFPGDPNGRSKWTLLHDALVPMVASLTKKVTVGAKFFPEAHDPAFTDPSVACAVLSSVDFAPSSQPGDFLSVFETTKPAGGTPTADALRASVDYLTGRDDRAVSKFIVLATDGAPNCNGDPSLDPKTCVCTTLDPNGCRTGDVNSYNCLDDVRTVSVIDEARTQTIPTYVLGLGTQDRPEFTAALERMAVAGGRPRTQNPKFYSVDDGTALQAALDDIEQGVADCTYVTPSRPDDPEGMTITINGQPVLQDETRQNGWDWLDREFGKIGFFGASCAVLHTSASSGSVNATVACH
jgi:hypothetical protein